MKRGLVFLTIFLLMSACLPASKKGALQFSFKENQTTVDREPVKVPVVNFAQLNETLFKTKCATCHSDRRRAGGLRLEQYEDFVDELVLPGDADNSYLLAIVTDSDPDIRMPPRRAPLTAEEVAMITQWINDGAAQ